MSNEESKSVENKALHTVSLNPDNKSSIISSKISGTSISSSPQLVFCNVLQEFMSTGLFNCSESLVSCNDISSPRVLVLPYSI